MATQLNTEMTENINVFLSSLIEDVENALLLMSLDNAQPNPAN